MKRNNFAALYGVAKKSIFLLVEQTTFSDWIEMARTEATNGSMR
jgi:hypothetical protein